MDRRYTIPIIAFILCVLLGIVSSLTNESILKTMESDEFFVSSLSIISAISSGSSFAIIVHLFIQKKTDPKPRIIGGKLMCKKGLSFQKGTCVKNPK